MKVNQKTLTLLSLLFTSLSLILYACASGHLAPFTDTPPPQRNLSAYEQRLQTAVTSSRHLTLEEIGRVSYPGFQAPLWRIWFRPDGAVKYKVLFSAGIHGNEPAGVECTLRFVEAIARKPENYKDIAFDIIPLVNPWGWTHDIRFNQAGIDINRDFATLNSQEAKIYAAHRTAEHCQLQPSVPQFLCVYCRNSGVTSV
ncbi:MAG: DUF2817 domain-containing protein [Desulfobacterales bacterium]